MRKAVLAFVVAAVSGGLATVGVACSSSSNHGSPGTEAGTEGGNVEGGGEGGGGGFSPTLACADTIDSVYADPGDVSGLAKGAIIKCAHDQDYTAADLLGRHQCAERRRYAAVQRSALHERRARLPRPLSHRARRPEQHPGLLERAAFSCPTHRAASQLPVVVASHGSRGQAAACAP